MLPQTATFTNFLLSLFLSLSFFSLSLSLSHEMPSNHSCPKTSRQLGLSAALWRRHSSQKDLASAERRRGSRSRGGPSIAGVAASAAAALAKEGGPPVRRSTVAAPTAQTSAAGEAEAATEAAGGCGEEGAGSGELPPPLHPPPPPPPLPLPRDGGDPNNAAEVASGGRKSSVPSGKGPPIGQAEPKSESANENEVRGGREDGFSVADDNAAEEETSSSFSSRSRALSSRGRTRRFSGLTSPWTRPCFVLNFGNGEREGSRVRRPRGEKETPRPRGRERETGRGRRRAPHPFHSLSLFRIFFFLTMECRAAHPLRALRAAAAVSSSSRNPPDPEAASLEVPAAEARTRWTSEEEKGEEEGK